MAYEEVGMPSLFFGKKKYILRPHVKGVTFGKKPMVRGIDTVKQGKSRALRDVGTSLIEKLLDIREDVDICATIGGELRHFYEHPHDVSEFIQHQTNRANGNVMVKRYVERMTERYQQLLRDKGPADAAPFDPPKLNDKFAYVVVVRNAFIDANGHSITFKIGDKMEPPQVVASGQAQLDLEYYTEGTILVMLARLASCDARFDAQTGETAPNADEDYQKYDEWRLARAKKFLLGICAEYTHRDDAHHRALGRQTRSAVGAFHAIMSEVMTEQGGFRISARIMRVIINNDIRDICRSHDIEDAHERMTSMICDIATDLASDAEKLQDETDTYSYIEALGRASTPSALATMYSAQSFALTVRTLDKMRANTRNTIKTLAPRVITFWRQHRIGDLISSLSLTAADTGNGGKKILSAQIRQQLHLRPVDIDLLNALEECMIRYRTASSRIRKEGKAREQYAPDFHA
jgi:hypothetical protein